MCQLFVVQTVLLASIAYLLILVSILKSIANAKYLMHS